MIGNTCRCGSETDLRLVLRDGEYNSVKRTAVPGNLEQEDRLYRAQDYDPNAIMSVECGTCRERLSAQARAYIDEVCAEENAAYEREDFGW